MATRTFDSLLPKILENAPGCPQPTALQHIRDAARRACERSLLWRYEAPLMSLLPGVYEYDYPKPPSTDVHVVFGAVLNDSPLERLNLEDAITAYPAWADLYSGASAEDVWSQTPSGAFNEYEFNEAQFNGEPTYVTPDSIVADGSQPRSFAQLTPDRFIVLPLPDAEEYHLRLFLALKPSRTALGMEEMIFNELEDAIAHSALQSLLAVPNENWMNLELAAYHARQFVFHVTERRARGNTGNARATLHARFPAFGA